MAIKIRTKELRHMPASELLANPRNHRLHDEDQRDAMRAVLDQYGFAGAVLAYESDDGLVIVDGHLRAELAGDELVPVLIADLDPEEANGVLAFFDHLGKMARTDQEAYRQLLQEIDTETATLVKMIEEEIETAEKQLSKLPRGAKQLDGVPGMDLLPHEHYDWLGFLCKTTQQWNQLCELFDIRMQKTGRDKAGWMTSLPAETLIEKIQSLQAEIAKLQANARKPARRRSKSKAN